MQRTKVLEQLQNYFIYQVLDGNGMGLDDTTPLLEWGLINSIEIVRLLNFMNKQFEIDLPMNQLTADNLVDLGAITDMVLRNQGAMATALSPDGTR
ncbi:MAG: phosphopantetheine-binding protein [Ktedonobacteraceae bacterium]